MLLKNITSPTDLRQLSLAELAALADEIRAFIIDVVSRKGGHLGANLGVVELSVALHYVFNTPDDKLIWDVGHQCYAHKLLTFRHLAFENIREFGGISGFPVMAESEFDSFGTGHSSTSISAILAMAMASELEKNTSRSHIAVIGDASIASGMAFEALNFSAEISANVIIILNDNGIGIDHSVGGLKHYLNKLSAENGKNEQFFTNLGIHYHGIIDGHCLSSLVSSLQKIKNKKGIQLLHIKTTKGKGLQHAENEQVTYHSPGKFDKLTGKQFTEENSLLKFQDIVGISLKKLAQQNEKIVVISPAMLSGSGLMQVKNAFPKRVFDVGIAEQHAVTFAAGWAASGFIPFCVIYSTFLQRAYDQLIHDVALQNLPVIFCIDRAGMVGEDGATHHGVFDMAFLRIIPNLIIASPSSATELANLLYTSQLGLKNPIVIRYPRGHCNEPNWVPSFEKIEIGKAKQLKNGKKYAVISIGAIAVEVSKAIEMLENQEDYAHFDIRFLKPLDESILHTIFASYSVIFSVEEGTQKGGLGGALSEFATEHNYRNSLKIIGLADEFVPFGSYAELQKITQLNAENIAKKIAKM